jgi:hypothetical protein
VRNGEPLHSREKAPVAATPRWARTQNNLELAIAHFGAGLTVSGVVLTGPWL